MDVADLLLLVIGAALPEEHLDQITYLPGS